MYISKGAGNASLTLLHMTQTLTMAIQHRHIKPVDGFTVHRLLTTLCTATKKILYVWVVQNFEVQKLIS